MGRQRARLPAVRRPAQVDDPCRVLLYKVYDSEDTFKAPLEQAHARTFLGQVKELVPSRPSEARADGCAGEKRVTPGAAARLPPPDERHLCRHHGHEQDVGFERQARHVDDGVRDVLHVHQRFDRDLAVRLQHALRHPLGHFGERVADVDLAAGDVVLAAVERGGLGEAGDRVFGGGLGRGIRPRRVRRDRAVVDDAAAARRLRLHQLERFLRAEKHAGQVGVDNVFHCSNESPRAGSRRVRRRC